MLGDFDPADGCRGGKKGLETHHRCSDPFYVLMADHMPSAHRRFAEWTPARLLTQATKTGPALAVLFGPADWPADQKTRMAKALKRLAQAAKADTIPGGSIEDGALRIERLSPAVPVQAEGLVVDDATRFTEGFTHIRTGAPCKDRICLLTVLLAEGLNLGLSKMSEASDT